MLTESLQKLTQQQPLSQLESKQLAQAMLAEQTPVEQIAAAMALLNLQQTNIDMLTGIATCMREYMTNVNTQNAVLDIVGTGGDGANTINISTGSALLLSACGVSVAKHGNRAVSSQCGSADVLEALSFKLDKKPKAVSESIAQHGFGFCFAPYFHPALLKLRTTRKTLGIPTIFNLMGPLLNPANAEYLMIGVYKAELIELFAKVLTQLPIKAALVFHSAGLDELSCAAPAEALLIKNQSIQPLLIDALNYGLPRCKLSELTGGNAQHNAQLLIEVFSGAENAIANTLILNAGVGLFLYGKSNNIKAGVDQARKILQSGKVLELIKKLSE